MFMCCAEMFCLQTLLVNVQLMCQFHVHNKLVMSSAVAGGVVLVVVRTMHMRRVWRRQCRAGPKVTGRHHETHLVIREPVADGGQQLPQPVLVNQTNIVLVEAAERVLDHVLGVGSLN